MVPSEATLRLVMLMSAGWFLFLLGFGMGRSW